MFSMKLVIIEVVPFPLLELSQKTQRLYFPPNVIDCSLNVET